MNLNDSCGTDVFLTESSPAVVQALYLLSLKLTLSAHRTEMTCIRRLDIFHCRKCFFFTDTNAKKHLNKTKINFFV
jgi:hypothetical protein